MLENCLKRGRDTGFTEMQLVPMDDWGTQVKSSRISLDHGNKKEEACKTPPPPTRLGIPQYKKIPQRWGEGKTSHTSRTDNPPKTPQNQHTPPSITQVSFVTDGRLENLGNNYATAGYYYMEIKQKKIISALARSPRNHPVILSELSQAVYGVIITHIKVFNLHLVTTGVNARFAECFVTPVVLADPLAILTHLFLTPLPGEKCAPKPVNLLLLKHGRETRETQECKSISMLILFDTSIQSLHFILLPCFSYIFCLFSLWIRVNQNLAD